MTVSSFALDNAAYMSKAFQFMQGILSNAVHITCKAYICSLAGDTWRKILTCVDKLVASFKAMFTHNSGRKKRYKIFKQQKTGEDDVPLPLVPVLTTWNSWFELESHHAK